MSTTTVAIIALAKAMATADGKLDAFLAEARSPIRYGNPAYTGHYDGYMHEAISIVEDLNAAGFAIVAKA